jgi:endo-1,4-beta-mannosidase
MIPVLLVGALTLAPAEPMPRIEVAKDVRGFILAPSGRPFSPWGVNYGHNGKLIEDIWETDWPAIEADWNKMKGLGANVVRVHLQFGKFMEAADTPNAKALDRLGKLLDLSEKTDLYLDLTGLACYRAADVPPWYDKLDERARWAAQAKFWGAIADRCRSSPAVFCYDLINEPLSPADNKTGQPWYTGHLGEYDFLQWIAHDPAGKTRTEIARQWIRTLTAAIREKDKRHLITVGMLPSTPAWGYFSGFEPKVVAPELDFISVHIYPESKKVDQALKTLEGFDVGKPVVIEETFNLSCSTAESEEFIRRSRTHARGWMGHYDGRSIEELEALKASNTLTLPQAIYLDWLALFRRIGPEMKGASP